MVTTDFDFALRAYQTGLLPLPTKDLLTQLRFNPSGHLLASASLDHSLRISQRSTQEGGWSDYAAELKAHDSPVLSLAWAPSEWGKLIATGATDGTIKLWTVSQQTEAQAKHVSPHAVQVPAGQGRLKLVATLTDPRGTVRDLAFSPAELGFKLAAIASDSRLRVWECLDPVALAEWTLETDIDLAALPTTPSSGAAAAGSGLGLGGLAAPGSANGSGVGGSTAGGSSSASGSSLEGRRGGTVESDGGWALSWCGEGWWGERLAVSSGTNGLIRLFHLPAHAPWHNFLVLAPPRSPHSANPTLTQAPSLNASVVSHTPPTSSLAWSPPSGRSYQLLASGARDGKARLWRLQPPALETEGQEGGEWTAQFEAELGGDDGSGRGGAVSGVEVEWNLTGTVVSTTGAEGGVRLWKASYAGEWKLLAKISTDEGDEGAMELA